MLHPVIVCFCCDTKAFIQIKSRQNRTHTQYLRSCLAGCVRHHTEPRSRAHHGDYNSSFAIVSCAHGANFSDRTRFSRSRHVDARTTSEEYWFRPRDASAFTTECGTFVGGANLWSLISPLKWLWRMQSELQYWINTPSQPLPLCRLICKDSVGVCVCVCVRMRPIKCWY